MLHVSLSYNGNRHEISEFVYVFAPDLHDTTNNYTGNTHTSIMPYFFILHVPFMESTLKYYITITC